MTLMPSARVLASAYSDPATGGTGRVEPILWVNQPGKGRAYFTALGHEIAAMQNDGFKAALLRGAEWAATGAVTLPVDAGTTKAPKDALRAAGRHRRPRLPHLVLHAVRGSARVALDARSVERERPSREDVVSRYDVIVFYDMPKDLSAEGRRRLQAFAEAGKGIVALHHSICSYQGWPFWEELVGGRYFVDDAPGQPKSTYQHDVELFVKTAGSHPIVDPIGPLQLLDETYKGMRVSPKATPLLQIDHPAGDRLVAWVSPYAASRVVYVQLGHDEHAHQQRRLPRAGEELDPLDGRPVEIAHPASRFRRRRRPPTAAGQAAPMLPSPTASQFLRCASAIPGNVCCSRQRQRQRRLPVAGPRAAASASR